MDAFADPRIDTVVLMTAAQCGKTEAIFNVLGWMFDSNPRPAILVCPTQKLAYTLSRERIDAMLKTAPGLWEKVDQRYNKPGSIERFIGGARFGLAWAGSATELSSHPCAMVLVDERDRMGEDVGGEGDPVRLAQARTKNYMNSKVGVFSTPTSEGASPIYDWWTTGSRHRWCWQCPECGHWFAPELQHAHYPEKAEFQTIREESYIACPECDHAIRDDDRETLAADYVPHAMDEDGNLQAAPGLEVLNSVASYWVTGFASSFVTIGAVMENYARAARQGELGDVQAVVNTWAGELWRHAGEGVDNEDIANCQVDAIPDADVQMVTVGVDVQKDSLYYVVRGWGAGVTSWLLDHGQLHGATEYDDVWIALANTIDTTYCGHAVRMVLVDSGYNTHHVYEVCRRTPTWFPSRGYAKLEKPYRDRPVDESSTGRSLRFGLKMWQFDSDVWKTWLYARIRWPDGQPGGWFVPRGISDEYASQVTNERVRITRGRREWYTTGSRANHYMDCEVLATVAAHINNVRTLRPRPEPPPVPDVPPTTRQQHNPLERRTL